MAPRWLNSLTSFFMKRRRSQHRVDHFTFSDDEEHDTKKPPIPPVCTEKHCHVDWSHGDARTSTQTAYFDVPSSPKRQRSLSLPSLASIAPSSSNTPFINSSGGEDDLEYLMNKMEMVEDDEMPRDRTAGDRPLLMWLEDADDYLQEMLHGEGRGDFADCSCPCGQLGVAAIYRCEDCLGNQLYCETCTVDYHRKHPLHRVKRWTGEYFERVPLKALGVRVQLGHEPGEVCLDRKTAPRNDFVLLDVLGIHEITLDYCGCHLAQPHHKQLLRAAWYPATSVNPKTATTFRLLEVFHTLSNQSKVSGWEYYCALAQRTDNTGTNPARDRYRTFMLMVCEWRHLKMMKRAGRGNVEGGIASAVAGSCVVECPACPLPGKNLPEDWEQEPPHQRYLYRLYVAIDANFRLKRKKVSSDTVDPSLNKGCAYVVEETAYKAHLAQFDDLQNEATENCNNHNAVKLATLKGAAGLAASGVATVDCARHDMKRPCLTGDLQKGERYVNIDYLFRSSLQQNAPPNIAASYDISCQYSRKIGERFNKYTFDISRHDITWGIPKFHINAHQESCRTNYN
ncbi:hypothetical protein TRAPUB_3498 [Trametes pubescens]|uniref:CxC2-like cysteine cluster KDZ transposase-associated domain-containing protein n=1 Tax=Trametes pubescens TaxID=154538 RepID=A0A1M2VDL3_TRAPU|nr:hypothetical protein TRAPUB_3498 [Trametes pubescens]